MAKQLHLFSAYHAFERFVNRRFHRLGIRLHEVDIERYHLEYWDSETEKPVMLLLPAFAPEAKYSWFKQAKVLSRFYRVIIPNYIYFGKSTSKTDSYHIKDQAQAILSILKHLKLEKVSICGASYGVLVALELVANRSIEIEKMVLASAPLKFSDDHSETFDLGNLGVVHRADLLVPKSPVFLKKLFDFTHYKKLPIPFFVFKNLYKNLYISSVSDKQKLVETFMEDRTDFKNWNYEVNFPVLVLNGEGDKLVPVAIPQELQRRLGAQAKLIVIPKTAHMPNYEKPKLYNRILISFLRSDQT
jgi:pimeloyl-ACP methyl ester carboxylesterase